MPSEFRVQALHLCTQPTMGWTHWGELVPIVNMQTLSLLPGQSSMTTVSDTMSGRRSHLVIHMCRTGSHHLLKHYIVLREGSWYLGCWHPWGVLGQNPWVQGRQRHSAALLVLLFCNTGYQIQGLHTELSSMPFVFFILK